MSHVWPVIILISALRYHKLHNANLYACRIVVPWPLISPTFFPRKLLDLPTSLPPPPSPTLSWIFTSPQPPSSSSSHFIAIFSLFFLHSVISSFHPYHDLSHLRFVHYLSRLLCFNIPPSPSLHFRVRGFPSARSCCRPRANSSALAKELHADRSKTCRNIAKDLILCVAQIIFTAQD